MFMILLFELSKAKNDPFFHDYPEYASSSVESN